MFLTFLEGFKHGREFVGMLSQCLLHIHLSYALSHELVFSQLMCYLSNNLMGEGEDISQEERASKPT